MSVLWQKTVFRLSSTVHPNTCMKESFAQGNTTDVTVQRF